MNENNLLNEENIPEEKSKSQVKRELLALQDLGKTLINLSEKQLAKIEMEDKVRQQVLAAKTMQRGALKRQIQYLGKLLRLTDIEPIERGIAVAENLSEEHNAHFHRLEKLRDALLNDNEEAFAKLLTIHPNIDRQHIRQLIRNAQKEREHNKPPAAARALFKYLRELSETPC